MMSQNSVSLPKILAGLLSDFYVFAEEVYVAMNTLDVLEMLLGLMESVQKSCKTLLCLSIYPSIISSPFSQSYFPKEWKIHLLFLFQSETIS